MIYFHVKFLRAIHLKEINFKVLKDSTPSATRIFNSVYETVDRRLNFSKVKTLVVKWPKNLGRCLPAPNLYENTFVFFSFISFRYTTKP